MRKFYKSVAILIYTIIIILILFHYRESYWLKFYAYLEQIPLKFRIILHMCQIILLLSIAILFIFFEQILKHKIELFVLLISFCATFFMLEIFANLYICNFAPLEIKSRVITPGQCGAVPGIIPMHYLLYHGTPGYESLDKLNMHNSYGFRGPEILIPKPNNRFRIVTIGGSTTYTASKSWRDDFARNLQKYLNNHFQTTNIEVINAGFGGWTTYESLINLEFNILDMNPDMIIIYHNTNDVYARIVNAIKYKGDNSALRKIWTPLPYPIFLKSTMIRWLGQMNPRGGLSSYVVHEEILKINRQSEEVVKEWNMTQLQILKQNRPIFYERNIRNMIAIAEEFNISVVLATWASNPYFNDFTNTSHYKFGYNEHNQIIKNIAQEKGIPVYDFNVEMNRDKSYWADGRHVNEKGSDLKGKLFSNFIIEQNLIPEINLLDKMISKINSPAGNIHNYYK